MNDLVVVVVSLFRGGPNKEMTVSILSTWEYYCTITTLGSQGVMRDGRERYQVMFTAEILAWFQHIQFIFSLKMDYRPRSICDLN